VNRTTLWVVSVIGVVIAVVGVLVRSSHQTIGLAAIIVGALVAVVGIVMALMRGGGAKAA
jgi:hypothetical protein